MDEKQLQDLANELAKNLKTPEVLSQFDRLLKCQIIWAMIKIRLNWVPIPAMVIRQRPWPPFGPLVLCTSGGREASFEPHPVKKNQTWIQRRIVHMVRNSLRFVSWKDYKAVTRDLKAIYQAPTEWCTGSYRAVRFVADSSHRISPA